MNPPVKQQERVIEKIFRHVTKIFENQFGFMLRRSIVKAIL